MVAGRLASWLAAPSDAAACCWWWEGCDGVRPCGRACWLLVCVWRSGLCSHTLRRRKEARRLEDGERGGAAVVAAGAQRSSSRGKRREAEGPTSTQSRCWGTGVDRFEGALLRPLRVRSTNQSVQCTTSVQACEANRRATAPTPTTPPGKQGVKRPASIRFATLCCCAIAKPVMVVAPTRGFHNCPA